MIPKEVELCLGQRMMLLRVKTNFESAMLMHWLNSPSILQRVKELTGGTASPHLNIRDIRAFPVPSPPLPEQQEIVRRVEALFAFADRIEARLATAQATVARLTPSTLAKAFRGELVPQDPDDEPAAALLERTRRQTTAKPGREIRKHRVHRSSERQ
jgi:type I restriction enzyme S subunit